MSRLVIKILRRIHRITGVKAAALSVLHRMLAAGDRHPLVVMATLQRHYGSMLRLDGSGATSEAAAAEVSSHSTASMATS